MHTAAGLRNSTAHSPKLRARTTTQSKSRLKNPTDPVILHDGNSDLQKHLPRVQTSEKQSEFSLCDSRRTQRRLLTSHYDRRFPEDVTWCSDCGQEVHVNDMRLHCEEECLMRIVKCRFAPECMAVFPFCHKESHESNEFQCTRRKNVVAQQQTRLRRFFMENSRVVNSEDVSPEEHRNDDEKSDNRPSRSSISTRQLCCRACGEIFAAAGPPLELNRDATVEVHDEGQKMEPESTVTKETMTQYRQWLEAHRANDCPKSLIGCQHAARGCKAVFERQYQHFHETEECIVLKLEKRILDEAKEWLHEIVTCDWCHQEMEQRLLVKHQEESCPARELPCPNTPFGCDEYAPASEMDYHVQFDCKVTRQRAILAKHSSFLDEMLSCPECGNSTIRRRNMTKHIHLECPQRLIRCRHHVHGCLAYVRARSQHAHEDMATMTRPRPSILFNGKSSRVQLNAHQSTIFGNPITADPTVSTANKGTGMPTDGLRPPFTAEFYVFRVPLTENLFRKYREALVLENTRLELQPSRIELAQACEVLLKVQKSPGNKSTATKGEGNADELVKYETEVRTWERDKVVKEMRRKFSQRATMEQKVRAILNIQMLTLAEIMQHLAKVTDISGMADGENHTRDVQVEDEDNNDSNEEAFDPDEVFECLASCAEVCFEEYPNLLQPPVEMKQIEESITTDSSADPETPSNAKMNDANDTYEGAIDNDANEERTQRIEELRENQRVRYSSPVDWHAYNQTECEKEEEASKADRQLANAMAEGRRLRAKKVKLGQQIQELMSQKIEGKPNKKNARLLKRFEADLQAVEEQLADMGGAGEDDDDDGDVEGSNGDAEHVRDSGSQEGADSAALAALKRMQAAEEHEKLMSLSQNLNLGSDFLAFSTTHQLILQLRDPFGHIGLLPVSGKANANTSDQSKSTDDTSAKNDPDPNGVVLKYSVPRGKWVHLAFVASSSRIELFSNGELVATEKIASDSKSKAGNRKTSSKRASRSEVNRKGLRLPLAMVGSPHCALHGYIQEVRFWNIVRPAEHIRTYMNDNLPLPPAVESSDANKSQDSKPSNEESGQTSSGTKPKKKTKAEREFLKQADIAREHLLGYWTFEENYGEFTEDVSNHVTRAVLTNAQWVNTSSHEPLNPGLTPSFRQRHMCIVTRARHRLALQQEKTRKTVIRCPQGCKQKIPKLELDRHMAELCPRRPVVCRVEGCGRIHPYCETEMHLSTYCLPTLLQKELLKSYQHKHEIVPCQFGCGIQGLTRGKADFHLRHECPERRVNCPEPGCDITYFAKHKAHHDRFDCESYVKVKRDKLAKRARARYKLAAAVALEMKNGHDEQEDDVRYLGVSREDSHDDGDENNDDDDPNTEPRKTASEADRKWANDVVRGKES